MAIFKFCILFCVILFTRSNAKVLRVYTITSPPYYTTATGSDQGFVVDLIKEIRDYIKNEFNETYDFEFKLTPDGNYGRIVNGTPNGMIGQVYSGLADLAAADITITDERKQFVDFTEPFLDGSISILIHKDHGDGITSIRDLADRQDIEVGCRPHGSTYLSLSQSNDPKIKRLFERMLNQSSFIDSYKEGIERVKSSKFAYLGESSILDYITSFDCYLMNIKDRDNLFPKSYGFAVPKGVDYLDKMNAAISHLKTSGKMNEIWNKYWKENCLHLRGVTIINQPYVIMKDTLPNKNGLTGFGVEMMDRIAAIAGFNYSLYLSPDGAYGMVKNGTYVNGMLGEVLIRRADFSLGDITVTEQRRQFVDFSEPFLNTSMALLISKDNSNNITSFADLADQTDISFGILGSGATNWFMANSNDPVMIKLYERIKNNPELKMKSNREGIDRVKTSRYAHIMEASVAKYLSGIDCSLTYIQEDYYPRQYALALPKNSVLKEKFNSAIRQMKESGELDQLFDKYWPKCE